MAKKTTLEGMIFRAASSFIVVAAEDVQDVPVLSGEAVGQQSDLCFYTPGADVMLRGAIRLKSDHKETHKHNIMPGVNGITHDVFQYLLCCLHSRWNVARIFWIYLMCPSDKEVIESVWTEEGKTRVTHCHIEAERPHLLPRNIMHCGV